EAFIADDVAAATCRHRKQSVVKIRPIDRGVDDLTNRMRGRDTKRFAPLHEYGEQRRSPRVVLSRLCRRVTGISAPEPYQRLPDAVGPRLEAAEWCYNDTLAANEPRPKDGE